MKKNRMISRINKLITALPDEIIYGNDKLSLKIDMSIHMTNKNINTTISYINSLNEPIITFSDVDQYTLSSIYNNLTKKYSIKINIPIPIELWKKIKNKR